MSDMEISKVIAQMRALSSEIRPPVEPPAAAATEKTEFTKVMQEAINSVSDTQRTASDMAARFQTGESDASVAEVMVAMQKSSLSFTAMNEVRNRLVEAYQEIMRMPL